MNFLALVNRGPDVLLTMGIVSLIILVFLLALFVEERMK